MPRLNKIMIMGHLGRDPELRYTPSGLSIVNFSVATNDGYKSRDGEWQDRTTWHDCTAFGNRAEWVAENLGKGSGVYVEGRLYEDEWEAQDGSKRKKKFINVDNVQLFVSDSNRPVQQEKPAGMKQDDIPF